MVKKISLFLLIPSYTLCMNSPFAGASATTISNKTQKQADAALLQSRDNLNVMTEVRAGDLRFEGLGNEEGRAEVYVASPKHRSPGALALPDESYDHYYASPRDLLSRDDKKRTVLLREAALIELIMQANHELHHAKSSHRVQSFHRFLNRMYNNKFDRFESEEPTRITDWDSSKTMIGITPKDLYRVLIWIPCGKKYCLINDKQVRIQLQQTQKAPYTTHVKLDCLFEDDPVHHRTIMASYKALMLERSHSSQINKLKKFKKW